MKKLIIIILSIVCYQLSAQQINKKSIDSGGGAVITSEFSIIHTIGELVVAENAAGNIRVSEGFINDRMMITTGIDNFSVIEGITIYPNPTSDILNVNFLKQGSYKILLSDNKATLIKEYYGENISEKSINIGHLNSGIYFLTIISINENLFQSYKVIKR